MSKNYMQEIKSRILASEDGSVFSTSDFADIADTNTVRSALYRLVKDNILRRIINGIFSTINNIVVHLPLFSGTLYICLSCIHCTVSESFVRVTKPAISGGILYTLIPRI